MALLVMNHFYRRRRIPSPGLPEFRLHTCENSEPLKNATVGLLLYRPVSGRRAVQVQALTPCILITTTTVAFAHNRRVS